MFFCPVCCCFMDKMYMERIFWGKKRWVVRVPKQGPNPSKKQNHSENCLFDPNFTFCFPKSHKNSVVGSHIWENFPKKKRFSLDGTPKILNASVPWVSQTLSFRAQECEKKNKSSKVAMANKRILFTLLSKKKSRINLLWCYPNVKLEIRNLSLITSTAPIFLQFNYFRQNLEENVTFYFFSFA